jgi:hypothetical protein
VDRELVGGEDTMQSVKKLKPRGRVHTKTVRPRTIDRRKGEHCLGNAALVGVQVGVLATSLTLFNRAGPKLAGGGGLRRPLGLKTQHREEQGADCVFMHDDRRRLPRPSHASHRRRNRRCLSRTDSPICLSRSDSPIRVCRFDSSAFKLLLRRPTSLSVRQSAQ